MTEEQAKVREYHQRFGCTVNDRPTWAGEDEHRVRVGRPDLEVLDDGEFEKGRHHCADRGE